MLQTITVQPVETGWAVATQALATPLTFARAGEAEAEARRLAEHAASEGRPAEIRFHLRDGALAARFICAPEEPPKVVWEPSAA